MNEKYIIIKTKMSDGSYFFRPYETDLPIPENSEIEKLVNKEGFSLKEARLFCQHKNLDKD